MKKFNSIKCGASTVKSNHLTAGGYMANLENLAFHIICSAYSGYNSLMLYSIGFVTHVFY